MLLSHFRALLFGDLPLRQIDLIAHQADNDVAASLALDVFDPLADAAE